VLGTVERSAQFPFEKGRPNGGEVCVLQLESTGDGHESTIWRQRGAVQQPSISMSPGPIRPRAIGNVPLQLLPVAADGKTCG